MYSDRCKVWLEIHFSTQTGGDLLRFPAAFHESLVRNSLFYTNRRRFDWVFNRFALVKVKSV